MTDQHHNTEPSSAQLEPETDTDAKRAVAYVALVTPYEVARRLKARIVSEGITVTEWAARHKIAPSHVYSILRGERPAPPKLAKIIGLEPVRGYRDPRFNVRRRPYRPRPVKAKP